jgi:hypothetical protein
MAPLALDHGGAGGGDGNLRVQAQRNDPALSKMREGRGIRGISLRNGCGSKAGGRGESGRVGPVRPGRARREYRRINGVGARIGIVPRDLRARVVGGRGVGPGESGAVAVAGAYGDVTLFAEFG